MEQETERTKESKSIQELLPTTLTGPTTVSPFDEIDKIDLTMEETEAAVRLGKEKKYFDQRRQDYMNRIRSAIDWSIPTGRELYEELLKTKSQVDNKPFQVVDWNREVVELLCLYFSGDPEFEKRGFSLQKGIMLTGPAGVGKSHLMNFFADNPMNCYKNVTCKLVADRYRQDWMRDEMDALSWYSGMPKADSGHKYSPQVFGFCFGDLGTEEIKNSFGNTMNVMEHIIFQRYENKLPFILTHITTNMDSKAIEKKYGDRIRDRLKEMCNRFVLNGKSWRE